MKPHASGRDGHHAFSRTVRDVDAEAPPSASRLRPVVERCGCNPEIPPHSFILRVEQRSTLVEAEAVLPTGCVLRRQSEVVPWHAPTRIDEFGQPLKAARPDLI